MRFVCRYINVKCRLMIMVMMWFLIDGIRRVRKVGYVKGVFGKFFVKKSWGIVIFSFRVIGFLFGM